MEATRRLSPAVSAGPVEITAAPHAASGTTGAISEIRACAFLMEAGYYVYRCESPNAPFDLVAYKDGACCRVEVKTITHQQNAGRVPTFKWPTNDEWDLLVVVDGDVFFLFASGVTPDAVRDHLRRHYGLMAASLAATPGARPPEDGKAGLPVVARRGGKTSRTITEIREALARGEHVHLVGSRGARGVRCIDGPGDCAVTRRTFAQVERELGGAK